MRVLRPALALASSLVIVLATALAGIDAAAAPATAAGSQAAVKVEALAQAATSQPPDEPGTEVAGKTVDRAPAKVLADMDEMPRTGAPNRGIVMAAGWLILGVGLLMVDAAGVRMKRLRRR